MKKIITLLAVLALVVPTFADIQITAAVDGDEIVISSTGEGLRGVGLTIDMGAGSAVVAGASTQFNVCPDTACDMTKAYNLDDTLPPYAFGVGSPLAVDGAAGELVADAAVFAVSVGYLDEDGNETKGEAAPAGLEIARFAFTGAGTMTIALDDQRGGIVGDAAASLPVADLVYGGTTTEPYNGADVALWIELGRPASWLNNRQCHGDTNGTQDTFGRGSTSYVGKSDLAVLISGYQLPYVDPATTPWISADFDHDTDTFGRGSIARVGRSDLGILINNYQMNVPADCGQVAE